MDSVEQPTPEMHAMVFQLLLTADTHVKPITSVIKSLTKFLNDEEATVLPAAIRNVLPLLSGHTDKLRVAMDIASHLDLFELAPVAVKLAAETRDSRLTMLAASLCGNPGADSGARSYLSGEHPDDPWVQIRLNPEYSTSSQSEERLHQQCWPGRRSSIDRLGLTLAVVIDCALPPAFALELASDMSSHGLMALRLPRDVPIPNWFGPDTIFVSSASPPPGVAQLVEQSGARSVVIGKELPKINEVRKLIIEALPKELLQRTRLVKESPPAIWGPAIYSLGRYRTWEAAWHTGTKVSQWSHFSRKGWIEPQDTLKEGDVWWTFREIVAVRTWSYLQTTAWRGEKNGRNPRVPQQVISRLARFNGSDSISKLGVASNGDVIAKNGENWFNLTNDNLVMEPLITSDEVFRPFSNGDVNTLDLLSPKPDTRVHPTIANGKPHVFRSRVPAVAVAKIYARGGYSGALDLYPALAKHSFLGAVEVGKELLERHP